jgi:hypothetical protein
MKNIEKYIFYIIIIFIFLLGLFFRLKIYFFNRPLWLDECFIFENIYQKDFFGFFGELLCLQSSPPLFLCIEKVFMICWGIKEQVLRFFPFICSIFSIPCFYIFSKKFLQKHISIIIGNILFAVNIPILYYAQELKQYSSDIFCFMFLFLLLSNLTIINFKKKHIIYYSILTIIFPLLSIPSYFLITSWIFIELITYKTECIKRLIAVNIPLFIMSIFYCISTIIPQHNIMVKYYATTWTPGFISFNINQNIKLLLHNLYYFFEPCNSALFLCILICLGVYLLIKDKQKNVLLLFCSLFLILLFSLIKIYPLYERVCLYTVPILLVFIAKPFDLISTNKKVLSLILTIVFIISFNKYNFHFFKDCYNANIWKYSNPYPKQFINNFPNPRKLMQILMNNYNNEIVIINNSSIYEFKYYKLYYNFQPADEIFMSNIKQSPLNYEKELDEITQSANNYIFFFSNDFRQKNLELNCLKNWKNKHNVLYEQNYNGSYILYLKK